MADRTGANMEKTVRDIMQTDVQTIGPRHSLAKLQKVLIAEPFGWDWGPMAPTVGIWRPISIQLIEAAVLRHR